MRKSTFLFFWLLAAVPFPAKADVNLVELVKEVQPAVVTILTYDKEKKPLGQGSGFFINEKGHLITNYHVLKGAYSATVRAFDGKDYPVKLILADNEIVDLIKLSADIPEKAVRFVQVAKTVPEVAERIIVVGSPLGLEQTVSEGIVSAVRDIPTIGKIFQISAPISSGSSGSPVVNMKGQVIGVATFQLIEGQNLNFAVSGEQVLELKPQEKTIVEWTSGISEKEVDELWNLFQRGASFLLAGEYEKALDCFTKVIDADKDSALAWFFVGVCYSELDRNQEAVEAYKQAIRIKPDFAGAYINLGVTYGKLGRYQDSIESLKQAIRIKPDYAEAHYNLGLAYGKIDRYDEAVEAYKQAIRIKPDYADAHLNLGVAYGQIGRYDEATEAYKQAIRIKPDYAEAHYNLGVAYFKKVRYEEAIEAFKQAIRIKPDYADALYNLGGAYSLLGRYQEAIEAYKQAIRIKPDDADAHFTLGLSYMIVGDKGSALEEYKILKTLDKELANELFNLIYK